MRWAAGACAIATIAFGCRDDDSGEASPAAEDQADEQAAEQASEGDEPEAPPLPETRELPADPGEHKGSLTWARRFGGENKDAARGIAALGEGAVIVGYVSGGVGFGDATHQADEVDAYVMRTDGEGAPVWTTFLSGEGEDSANSVAVTEEGNILVAGAFAHDLAVGDGTLTAEGADDIFIAQFSPEGERMWARAFGGYDVDAAHHVSTGPGGHVYVTGVFREGVDFGDVTLESEGDADIFALALSRDGEPIWARRFGAEGPDYGRAIAPHPRGVALLAEYALEVDFGVDTLTSAGNRDLAIAMLGPEGEPTWVHGYGSYYNEVGVDLAVDPAGHLIATGSFDDEIEFGDETLEAAGESDAFIVKLDGEGSALWSRRVGNENEDVGASVATDGYGNIIAAGWFAREIEFGEGAVLESAGQRDGYIAKLSPEGDPLWAHSLGGELGDMVRSVTLGPDSSVFAAGTFHRNAQIGDRELSAAKAEGTEIPYGDAFVLRFAP